MNPGRLMLSLLLLGGGIGGFLAMGTSEVRKRPPAKETAPIVETVTAVLHRDGIQFEVDGIVVPFQQVEVAAEVVGRVAYKSESCRTGRAVKKGDLLLRIDQRDYDLEIARLTQELKQADAFLDELQLETKNLNNQVELAKQQLDIDTRELGRNEQLGETGALSESEVDKVRRAELTTRNSYQSLFDQRNLLSRRQVRLESAKELVQSQLDKAVLALSRTEIRAPIDGVVVSENVEQDGYVQMGSTVLTLQDTSRLDVTCKLYMRQMHWLWQSAAGAGSSAAESQPNETWRAYDFPETPTTVIYRLGASSFEWKGTLNRYDGPGIDNQTRMVPCRVHVTDPLAVSGSAASTANPPTLMTGMFVKVRVDAQVPIALVRVPQEAIQPGNVIWTVDDGKLRQQAAKIAHSDPEFVLLYEDQGGLKAGDLVVVSPLATPTEGLEVEAQPFSAAAAEKGPASQSTSANYVEAPNRS